ncbi:MAG TPA: histidine triad nucleotide-binding protein, partial [Gemmatimonadaceae bacterium]
MPDGCIFCRIARGEIPAVIVAESEMSIAFRDAHPEAPVHVLVIPREHFASLNEVKSPQLLADVMQLAVEVARVEGIAATGYRVVLNTGSDGGQTVFHLHAHVLGGRHMSWPPG